MTKMQIKQPYLQLSQQFSHKSFEDVESNIEPLLKAYYACFRFVLKMAQLYLHYVPKSPDQQKTLTRVIQLCTQINSSSEDVSLINEAMLLEAIACLQLGRPEEVLELLGSEIKNP